MIDINENYTREVECEYKGERYKVRDNGAICRMAREGKPKRAKDEVWTFGEKIDRGYARFCSESVHRIVAVAFHGEPPTNQHVVDHIDTNRQNNRPENLRWLTKLENILLNPFTKAKIEFWCGSVERFLQDPSLLKGHESLDPNFAWMRAVSSEEAKNTLANWEKILSKPRPVSRSRGNAIEEWIFKKNHHEIAKNNFADDFKQESKPIEPIIEIPQQPIVIPPVDIKPIVEPISKKEFITALIEICESEGWKYEKYYKTEKWKADILITMGEQKFAFMSSNSATTASRVLPLMEADGVKGFAFVLSPKKDIHADVACFVLYKVDDSMIVKVHERELSLPDFIKKAINNKIVHISSARITSVEVMFETMNCYSCNTPHSVFIIRYLVDEDGDKHDYIKLQNIYYEEDDIDIPDLQFNDEILGKVKQNISDHPEKKIVMGDVRERYSRTMGESYMSFGCPKCGSLVGDHYLSELIMDAIYETNENQILRIPLDNTFEIPADRWKINI